MAGIIGENAIGFAQFKLLGGWKNTFATCTTYAVIAAAVLVSMVKGVDTTAAEVFSYFIPLFLGLQVLALSIFGTARVGQSVRSDVAGKLLESHRLMPTSPGAAVLGYLIGSTSQASAFAVMNFAFGAVCTIGAGLRVRSWVVANLVLLLFSVFIWTITLFFSFRSNFATMGILVGLVITVMSRIPLLLVPAAGVLFSPIIGSSIFDARIGIGIDTPLILAAFAQIAIGGLFLFAATRRYRHDDLAGFDAGLGLLMLIIWTLTSVVAFRFPDIYPWWMRRQLGLPAESVFIGSASTVLLVAILPISSAVRAFELPTSGDHRRPHNPVWVMLASILIACCVVFSMEFHKWPPFHMIPPVIVLRTFAVIAAFLIGIRYVLGVAHRLEWGPRKFVIGWLMLTWGLPLAIEAFRSTLIGNPDEPMSQFAMCSPPTEIYQLWSHNEKVHTDRYGGLAVQCATAAIAAIVYFSLKPRRRPTFAPPTPPQDSLSPTPVPPSSLSI